MDRRCQRANKIKKRLYENSFRVYISLTIFLFSKRLRASKNSFLFSPFRFILYIMSLTEICDLPRFSCLLCRCLTITRSSLPQRQVVFRIKTTIVLTNVCSLVCLLDKSPIRPNLFMAFTFLRVCVQNNVPKTGDSEPQMVLFNTQIQRNKRSKNLSQIISVSCGVKVF